MTKLFMLALSVIIASTMGVFSAHLLPTSQTQPGTGTQTDIYLNETVTTTAYAKTIACGQGYGSIGRKTFVVENGVASSGTLSVTVELRDRASGRDFTSGYVTLYGVGTDSITYTVKTPTSDIAGRFCIVNAWSLNTSTVTMSMRKE